MELYEDKGVSEVEKKQSKLKKLIGVCIIISILIMIGLIVAIMYLQTMVTTIQLNGVKNSKLEEILYRETTETSAELHIPIIKMAQILGYKAYSGDYYNKSEDSTKCHAIGTNETVLFTLDSDTLVKIDANSQVEYITLDEPIFERNGELYTSIQGIEKAFNAMFSYDSQFKNISIYTMDYLVSYYATKLNITEYSNEFSDQKAILESMLIIKQDGKYGVINAVTGKSVLESKYEGISYLPVTTDFLVKSNGKYGIVTKEATTKVKTIYDQIKTIDNKNGLYLVSRNNYYGIIDIEGNIILEPNYSQIGIDKNQYTQNGVDNSYVLLDKIIPVKNSQNVWALFNLKGEQKTEFKYSGIGATSTIPTNAYPAVVIPEHDVIIVQKDKYYNLVTSDGEELIQENVLNSVYLKYDTITNENEYFMTYNNNEKVVDIENWLENNGR